MKLAKITFATTAFAALSACSFEAISFEGTRGYRGGDDYIAVAADQGQSNPGSLNDNAAIAVTPDGCQAWVIDDGIEGRASNRLDPVSGLPVCGGEPGVVYGNYQSGAAEIRDRVPRRTLELTTETVETRPTTGEFRTVHDESEPHDH